MYRFFLAEPKVVCTLGKSIYIPKFTRESPLPGLRNHRLLLPLKNISFKINVGTFFILQVILFPPHQCSCEMHRILILEKDAAAWKSGRGTCLHHVEISLHSGDSGVSVPHATATQTSQRGFCSRPFQTSVFNDSFPWCSLGVAGISVTYVQLSKALELSPSWFSSLLLQSLRRSREIQRVESLLAKVKWTDFWHCQSLSFDY